MNIGKKIKGLSVFLLVGCIIACITYGFIQYSINNSFWILILIVAAGIIAGYVLYLLFYGLGIIVDYCEYPRKVIIDENRDSLTKYLNKK